MNHLLHLHSVIQAIQCFEAALQLDHQNADARALLGNALYESDPGQHRIDFACLSLLTDRFSSAQAQLSYEHALALTRETKYRDSVMVRLGSLYLASESYQAAKEVYLRFVCLASPHRTLVTLL